MTEEKPNRVMTELAVKAGGRVRVTCDWTSGHPYALDVEYPSPVNSVTGMTVRLTCNELKALQAAIDGLLGMVRSIEGSAPGPSRVKLNSDGTFDLLLPGLFPIGR